jgi:uncharacterized protein with FMN-binding domain
MRRITTWLLSTVSALVLLFSYHTSTSSSAAGVVALGSANAGSGSTDGSGSTGTGSAGGTSGSSGSSDSATSGSQDSGSGSSGTSGSSGSGSSSSSSSASSSGTFTGDAVMTRFGPVQVEITVKKGQITKSVVTQVPWNNGRDQQINSYAVPVLNSEVVQAQSASIDMVSGATFTSEGYIQSLQSAIDQANL